MFTVSSSVYITIRGRSRQVLKVSLQILHSIWSTTTLKKVTSLGKLSKVKNVKYFLFKKKSKICVAQRLGVG